MKDGFVKVAAVSPVCMVADLTANEHNIIELLKEAYGKGVKIICFPRLCLCGASCGDLFRQSILVKSSKDALENIVSATAGMDMLVAVGFPCEVGGKLYSAAAVICDGKLLGIVPQTYLAPSDKRNFSEWTSDEIIDCGGVPFGTDQIFVCESMPSLRVGVELGEDATAILPRSASLAIKGANVILNLSSSPEFVGSAEARVSAIAECSRRICGAYVYANANIGESTTDMVYAGACVIAENGNILAENEIFDTSITVSDIDVELCTGERAKNSTISSDVPDVFENLFNLKIETTKLDRTFSKRPFVPDNKAELNKRCETIVKLQSNALAKRVSHIGNCKSVIGISGGLDSTLALLVSVKAYDLLGLDRKNIIAITMPGFGTTSRTKSNAEVLCERLGVDFRTISISSAVKQHFEDIGHDINVTDVTYENAQARERTQILMDVANECGAIVVGTGDLSELALGWATYNGDHMSMYGVNGSLTKTLIRYIVAYIAENTDDKETSDVLYDILDTPVSPELVPPKENGEIAQCTENIVGPYDLHDFYLYYFVRCGFSPSKIYRLAKAAWGDTYDDDTIKMWLKTFTRRFFTQQFKRSCMPDGPKVGTVSLSPRGDFCMPSDACAKLWLNDIDKI